jgi:general secretion pathway protein L
MKLRIFAPPAERPDPEARWTWMLFAARGEIAREGAGPLAEVPRADDVELALPAARVLFARLKLPRVGGATLRELLPYAVEDRLLSDPAHIHAVAGAPDARGESLVAVIDREWLGRVLQALAAHGLRPARAWCESALLGGGEGDWNLVLGPAHGMLVDDVGAGVAFDRDAAGRLPLAVRIALDEASARGERPGAIRVHGASDAPPPDLARWSAEASVAFAPGTRWETLARGEPAQGAIDLLPRDALAERSRLARLALPRAALALLAAIVVVQLALDGARAWSLARERSALRERAEAIFRGAFPEAKAIVDPRLQMERNLAELRRTRGLASGDDFLARLTEAARAAPGPARAIEFANGKLEVRRGEAEGSTAEARR